MMFSLLPVSAAAAGIPAEYAPIFKWAGGLSKRKINVELFFENESSPLGTTSSEGEGTICNINVPNGKEIYKSDASSGCSFAANKFTFWEVWDKSGDLKLYTRSTAGHTVTVNYVFKDASGNTKAPVTKSVKYNDTETFELTQDHYDYTIKHESGDATHKVDAFNRLSVTGGAENSVFTVTYTPKKNMAYLDQYYKKEGVIEYPKWNKEHLSFNGPDVLDNNRYEKAYLIQGGHLTELLESARFLDVDGTIYDFTAAKQLPSDLKVVLIDKVWYDREDAKWYYTSTAAPNIPVPFTSIVNLYYGEKHKEGSEYHQFDRPIETVAPTCTERGYTDYECRYCGKEGQREYVPSLGGHLWGDYKQDKNTKEKDSQHYQVCKRKGCNATSTPVGCNFDLATTETGTHTCTVCGYSYTDEVTPTETPVYVYFKTVHSKDGNVRVNDGDGVTYNNNTGGWATLGKLTTEQTVAVSTDKTVVGNLGAEVNKTNPKFVKHQDNENFDLDLISEWVELKKDNGAAGYVKEAPFGTEAWHLNGKVNVYKLSYNANRPVGVTASVTVPDSAYYLPGRNATVSTDDPTLQGYVFGGWYTEETCENKVENTVAVAEDTVLYAKWTLAQPTADLVDDAITIYHQVNSEADWHGGNAYADASAHPAGRTPTISYKAELDLPEMKLQTNIRTASIIAAYGEKPWEKLVEAVKAARGSLAMFSGSEIVLHVQLDKQLSTADIQNQLNNITVTSDWFELSKDGNPVVYDKDAQSLTITCVPKNKADGYSSTITLSGLNDLSLTSILSSGETRALAASGYITGSILISVPTVKVNAVTVETEDLVDAVQHGNGELYLNESIPLVLGSKTATNTAKLYWKEIKDNDDDDDDKYFFAIQKVDAQDGHALNDAKFELYQLDKDGEVVNRRVTTTRRHSSENGIALFSVSATKTSNGGSTWYYREITAPEGYVLDTKEYEISARDFYHDDQSKAVAKAETVRNYRGTTPDLLNDSDHFAYVIGYMDGNVRPYGLISRAETTTIFFRLLKDSVRDGNLLTSNTYTDVADDYWANTAISTMTGLGIVQGRSTTTFDPKAPITRAQFAAICARFDTGKSSGTQTFTDIKGHWAEKYIQRAAELGWIKGFEDGTFRPDTYITRAQAMTMINRVLNRIPEDESDLLPGMNVWPDCNPGDWFYLTVQEATNSHDFEHKAGNYETWTKLMKNPDWTRYEN